MAKFLNIFKTFDSMEVIPVALKDVVAKLKSIFRRKKPAA